MLDGTENTLQPFEDAIHVIKRGHEGRRTNHSLSTGLEHPSDLPQGPHVCLEVPHNSQAEHGVNELSANGICSISPTWNRSGPYRLLP